MNILIDIGHPGHVHLLHGVAKEMIKRRHKVFYSVREIPVAKRLMEHYKMTPWVDLGGKKDSLLRMPRIPSGRWGYRQSPKVFCRCKSYGVLGLV